MLSVIEESTLEHEIGQNGTAIESEWDQVFKCIKNCTKFFIEFLPRIYTTLKVNYRIRKKQFFNEKVVKIRSEKHLPNKILY